MLALQRISHKNTRRPGTSGSSIVSQQHGKVNGFSFSHFLFSVLRTERHLAAHRRGSISAWRRGHCLPIQRRPAGTLSTVLRTGSLACWQPNFALMQNWSKINFFRKETN